MYGIGAWVVHGVVNGIGACRFWDWLRCCGILLGLWGCWIGEVGPGGWGMVLDEVW